MITISGFIFPENASEKWEPTVRMIALHSKVLCVARTRVERAWSAYCFPVPGINHEEEIYLWRELGSKLFEYHARVLFPQFADLPYAR